MRRNHNRNLHSSFRFNIAKDAFVQSVDKREINKQAKDGFFRNVITNVFRFGRFLKRVFWGSTPMQPTFQKPYREVKLVPSKVVEKRRMLRQMQRDSRRNNRGAYRGK